MLGFPVQFLGEEPCRSRHARRPPASTTTQVLREVLGYDEARIAALRAAKTLG
jgi:hypothetical protein